MSKKVFALFSMVMLASMVLAACGTATTPTTAVEQPTTAVVEQPTTAPAPTGKQTVRWFVGLGTGTDPVQLKAELSVVDDFNKSQDQIFLVMEVIPFDSAKDTLSTEIAAGNGPDVIGPVGWGGSNAFFGQWLDISSEITAQGFDTTQFNPALVSMYETSEGQVGLPFAVYPSAMFYNTTLFDEAGLAYPPVNYGDKYNLNGTDVDWSWDTVAQVSKLLTLDSNGKNSTEDGFDATKIVQYGYTWQYENHPNYWGSFWAGGSMVAPDGKTAQAPDAWVAAWKWTYDAIWGAQPFMANAAVEGSPDFANGNPFNSNKVAMTDQPVWYTCCMGDVKTWDAGAMPTYNGKVGGRIDADTFRIWKGTKNPAAAFQVVSYLVTTGVAKLILGSADMPAAYGAVPARASDSGPWLDAKKAAFPQVKNWDTILAGLSYPDVPSAEGYMPNYNEAWTRGNTFANLLRNTAGLNLDTEIATYVSDLTGIFAK